MSAPLCPVCRSIFVRPRIYECGHSICENCMKGVDQYTERYFRELPNFKCPVCRHQTFVPWYRRPKNQRLQSICEAFPEYEARAAEVEKLMTTEKNEDDNLDIATLALTERKRLAKQYYREILPSLIEAAREGSSSVVISNKEKVQKIARVMDLFSKHLFRHKIYRIVTSHDELTISILRQRARVQNEYTNPDVHPSSSNVVTSEELRAADELLDSTSTFLRNFDENRTSNVTSRYAFRTSQLPLTSLPPRRLTDQ